MHVEIVVANVITKYSKCVLHIHKILNVFQRNTLQVYDE